MSNKKCFKCNFEKPLDLFYKHPQMPDGHVNKCKECNKKDTKSDYYRKRESESWMESEKIRSREKSNRLNYAEKMREVWNIDKPWRDSNVYKGLRSTRYYKKLPKEYHLHHWNYSDEYLEDVFILNAKDHSQLHTQLTLDLKEKLYYLKDGTYLDSKEKHKNYIKSIEIKIYNIEDF